MSHPHKDDDDADHAWTLRYQQYKGGKEWTLRNVTFEDSRCGVGTAVCQSGWTSSTLAWWMTCHKIDAVTGAESHGQLCYMWQTDSGEKDNSSFQSHALVE